MVGYSGNRHKHRFNASPLRMNESSAQIIDCLHKAQLLPPRCRCCERQTSNIEGWGFEHQDLLPWILEQWKMAAQHCQHRRRTSSYEQRCQVLKACQARDGKLLLDASFHLGSAFGQWLGWRFAWYPYGIPTGQLVGIASSRLGRRLDEKPGWFQRLRQYCRQLDPHNQLLLTVSQTAAAPYVARAAQLFEKPSLQATIIDSARWRYWGQLVWDTALEVHHPGLWSTLVSPVIDPHRSPMDPSQLARIPAHDRTLISASDKIWICQLRRNGILQQLVNQRLTSHWSRPGSIRRDPSEANVDQNTNQQKYSRLSKTLSSLTAPKRKASPVRHISETSFLQPPWKYLSHWTRRQDGPWPDQHQDQWLDELILEHPGRDRSALASLIRIVCQQQLLSSKDSIRGSHQVVCFTATPLLRWSSLRCYRAHRGRWDFEPYGICIKRDWLEQAGARPVIYGDDNDWQRLANRQRPFFQHRFGRNSSAASRWDWAIEQEWRYAQTLSLENLPGSSAFLFVPTQQEAESLASHSRWPVVFLKSARQLV